MQFYAISFMRSYKQSGRCHPDVNVKSVRFVGSHDMFIISQCTAQKLKTFLLFRL